MSQNQPKNKTILLFGTHGQDNWGDEILLETFLQSLGKENKYLINSYNPQQTLHRFGMNFGGDFDLVTFHTTKEVFKLPLRIFQSDIVFFAGGSILKELYKSYGRWAYSTLFMILGIVFFSKFIARKKLVTSNIGVGPIKTGLGRFLVKTILSFVDIISLRDEASKKLVLDSGVAENRLLVVPDIVFIRTPTSFLNGNKAEGDGVGFTDKLEQAKVPLVRGQAEGLGVVIGLNLNKDIAKPEMWPSLLENVSQALHQFKTNLENQGQTLTIIGIPMQIGFNTHHDLLILEQFSQQNPNLNIQIKAAATSTELAQIIQSCNFIIAERLHAIIISTILNTPSLPLIYDPKVDSLAKYLELSKVAIDINKPFKAQELNQKIDLILTNTNTIKQDLKRQYERLNQQNLEYFKNLKARLNLK